MTKAQQYSYWKTLTHLLHEARHGRPIDGRHGMEMAEALAPHWPSYSRTLACIARRMRALMDEQAAFAH